MEPKPNKRQKEINEVRTQVDTPTHAHVTLYTYVDMDGINKHMWNMYIIILDVFVFVTTTNTN